MNELEELDYFTIFASEVDHAIESSSFMLVEEEKIELSKMHWSTLTDQSEGEEEEEEVVEISNMQVFRALQLHLLWDGFFQTFGYELDGGRYGSMDELEAEKSLQSMGKQNSTMPMSHGRILRIMRRL